MTGPGVGDHDSGVSVVKRQVSVTPEVAISKAVPPEVASEPRGAPRSPGDDTICPECGTIRVRRDGLRTSVGHLTPEGRCSHCGEAIPGVGWDWAVGS